MAVKLNNPIALKSNEQTGTEFTLNAGQYTMAAGVGAGVTFPSGDITLQYKFGNNDWSNTDAVLNSGKRITVFWANAELTWRVHAAAAGAEVHIAAATMQVFPV